APHLPFAPGATQARPHFDVSARWILSGMFADSGISLDTVFERADLIDFQPHNIAGLEESAKFEAAAAADSSAAKHIARVKRPGLTGIDDHLLEGIVNCSESAIRPLLAVDECTHAKVVDVGNLVLRHQHRSDRRAEVLARSRAHADGHDGALSSARRQIVEDRVAGDRLAGRVFGGVANSATDDACHLALVVHLFLAGWERDRL